jgi:hypothetical protein
MSTAASFSGDWTSVNLRVSPAADTGVGQEFESTDARTW